MRRLLLFFWTGVMAIGCASSLQREAFEEIQVGDSAARVKSVFGTPERFAPSQKMEGAQEWYYTRHGTVCGFLIKGGVVMDRACDASQHRTGAATFLRGLATGVAAGAKGGAEAMKNNKQIHCNTVGSSTDCREY